MSKQRSPKQLAKFIDYVLSRRPDEFGLVMDEDGYVKLKDLLKAVNEEEGYRYVRQAHLKEIMLTLPDHSLEVADTKIRSKRCFITSKKFTTFIAHVWTRGRALPL